MRRFFILFLLLHAIHSSYCIPAYPRKIIVENLGVGKEIRIMGDEHHKRMETIDGYSICQDNNGKWCFAQLDTDGSLKPSPWSITDNVENNQALSSFLKVTPKHLNYPNNPDLKSPHHVNSRESKAPVVGERRVLIILMGFSDVHFSKTLKDFESLFNEREYHEDGAAGSVADFYDAASYGRLQLTCDVYGPYVAKNARKYYGGNDKFGSDSAPEELFKEAVTMVASEVNLSHYDSNGDGVVDHVHIIFAGYGEEGGGGAQTIWSHEAHLRNSYEIQSMKINSYSCAPELRGNRGNGISRIGPHCHEIGHALGAMDFYDTDYSENGEYVGTGDWDLMASGSWNDDGIRPADFNPYVKVHDFGWCDASVLPEGDVTIPPSYLSPDNYYFISAEGNEDYYLLENRSRCNEWGKSLPGSDLLIYHIHPHIVDAGNSINCGKVQMCYLVCASSSANRPSSRSTYGEINSAGCPYPGSSGKRNFTTHSTPQAFCWSGRECSINITDIKRDGLDNIILINSPMPPEPETEPEYILSEGFEGQPFYKIERVEGNVKWNVVDSRSPGSKVSLEPYEGFRFLQLQNKSFDSKQISNVSFQIKKASGYSSIHCSLNYYVQASEPTDSIMRIICTSDEYILDTLIVIDSTSAWKETVFQLPSSESIQFTIQGCVKYGESISIDNVSMWCDLSAGITGLSKFINGTNSSENSKFGIESTQYEFYSLDGHIFSRPEQGINIVRNKEGRVHKILIR